jgi:hypothetical protein
MMIGTWIGWCPQSDRQSKSPAIQQVAVALSGAIGKQQWRERVAARKRKQEETEAAHRQEEEAMVSVPKVELPALYATDPGMTLLTAVEYISPNPARRLSHYRCCSSEDRGVSGMDQDDARSSKIASSVAKYLTLLERRAKAKGFQVEEGWDGDLALERSRMDLAPVRSPQLPYAAPKCVTSLFDQPGNWAQAVDPYRPSLKIGFEVPKHLL